MTFLLSTLIVETRHSLLYHYFLFVVSFLSNVFSAAFDIDVLILFQNYSTAISSCRHSVPVVILLLIGISVYVFSYSVYRVPFFLFRLFSRFYIRFIHAHMFTLNKKWSDAAVAPLSLFTSSMCREYLAFATTSSIWFLVLPSLNTHVSLCMSL